MPVIRLPLSCLALALSMILAVALCSASTLHAVELPALFNHHMVLQRQMPVPVFGRAAPGTTVTVAFAGQQVSTTTDETGRWRLALAPMEANATGQDLVISGETTITLRDVLIGEVWLGAGQSNMVISVKGSGYSRDYPLDQPRPLIRYSGTPSDKILKPALSKARPQDLEWNPEWVPCTPENIPSVGGTLFAFADRLHAELGVPIGIVNRAIGGKSVGFFLDHHLLPDDPLFMEQVGQLAENLERDQQRAEQQVALWAEFSKAFDRETHIEMGFRKAPGLASGEVVDWITSNKKGRGYEVLIEPVLGFAIRGIVWDQGESGAGILGNRAGIGFATRILIRQWRQHWPEVPVLVMQKPSGHGRNS
jgi:sialate O-acetylesterase